MNEHAYYQTALFGPPEFTVTLRIRPHRDEQVESVFALLDRIKQVPEIDIVDVHVEEGVAL